MKNKNLEEKIRYILEELINQGNSEIIQDFFSSNYVAHARGKNYSGHTFLTRFSNQLRTAFPNVKVIDVTFLLQDQNRITWQRTLSGTNKASMQQIPASNKRVTWTEMVVTQFESGKISEEWIVSELMGECLLKAPKPEST
jgi:predicted ester cyclase